MSMTELDKFEYKQSRVILHAVDDEYVVSTAQRIRLDVVLRSTTTHKDYQDALDKFNAHRATIRQHRRCAGATLEVHR
ncbi:MAG: hypothetical protein E7011_03060 [Alphaproteobacteria bacterium]|nr:hypothetical protein [Alphaproteobacteria bacterium]